MPNTFAFRAFKECKKEINAHYWSYKVAGDYAAHIARATRKNDPERPTADLFKASGFDAQRIPQTVDAWAKAQKDMENWMRLSALASALSFLEIYVKQAVNSAFMADPFRVLGANYVHEGAYLLKYGPAINFNEYLIDFTKGDWPKRLNHFDKLFGEKPNIIKDNKSDFEKMR